MRGADTVVCVFVQLPGITDHPGPETCPRIENIEDSSVILISSGKVEAISVKPVNIKVGISYIVFGGDVCKLPSVLWHCWLSVGKSIWPVKYWVMRCWRGYLSGARCRWFACGPADATAIPIISCFIKIHVGITFLVPAYSVVLEKRLINGCLFVCKLSIALSASTLLVWGDEEIRSAMDLAL